MPPMNSSGMNTAISERLIEMMVKPISPAPLQRRLERRHARPRCGGRCSRSSRWRRRRRSRPRWSAPSATGCRGCSPAAYMTAKVPSSDSGTVTLGMIVAQTLRRNRKITSTTSAMVISSVNSHVVAPRRGWSGCGRRRSSTLDRRRDRRLQPRQRRLDALDRLDDVGAGLLEDRRGRIAVGLPFCQASDAGCSRPRRPPRRCRGCGPARRCGRRR